MPFSLLSVAQTPVAPPQWLFVVAGIVLLACLLIIGQFFSIWLQAYMSNAGVSFSDLIGMKLRKVDMRQVVDAKIKLTAAGMRDISVADLEAVYLAGSIPVAQAAELVGTLGKAVSPLRPTGDCEFGDLMVPCTAKADLISTGADVQVVGLALGRMEVAALGSSTSGPTDDAPVLCARCREPV